MASEQSVTPEAGATVSITEQLLRSETGVETNLKITGNCPQCQINTQQTLQFLIQWPTCILSEGDRGGSAQLVHHVSKIAKAEKDSLVEFYLNYCLNPIMFMSQLGQNNIFSKC